VVYPRTPPQGFDPLGYLARFIDCVELDDTRYHPLTPFMVTRWAEKTAHNPNFRFIVRIWQRFTHQREVQWSAADAAVFKKGIVPLAVDNRLGALLFQFPINFHFDERDRSWLQRLAREFEEFPRLIEVRHPSWVSAEGIQFLREQGFGFCAVAPSIFLKPIVTDDVATAAFGAFRLQGRAGEQEQRAEDFGDFMFGADEIAEFATRVRLLAKNTEQLFVTFANHARGQSVVNALQLKAALLGQRVPAPTELRQAFSLGDDLVFDLPSAVR
jgi:uncharacterized protein YecE (DUF72 family)